jgi:hypothetical protein
MLGEGEIEKLSGRHYIYNPYVLSLLYAKVLYLGRLRALYVKEVLGSEGVVEERHSLVRDNLYDRLLVADVFHMTVAMSKERFQFDLYYANFEYMLLRMLSLYGGRRGELFRSPGFYVEMGDLFFSDLKCMEVLGCEENKDILTEAVLHYIGVYYFRQLVDYNRNASTRVALLLNLKRAAECAVVERQGGDRDYTILYNRDVCTSLLYVYFLNEFLGRAREEKAAFALTHNSLFLEAADSGEGWAEAERGRQEECARLDHRILLMERLSVALARQYEDEFRGWSFVSVSPEHPQPLPRGEDHFARYTMVGCVKRRVNQVKGQGGDLVITEINTRNLRYLNLLKNRTHYEYVTRRLIFDQALRMLHYVHHHKEEEDPPLRMRRITEADVKRRPLCYPCRYVAQCEPLFDFYQQCEQYSYNTCHYVQRDSRALENEARLHQFLASVMIELLSPLESIIYKNLWQVQHLFASANLSLPLKEGLTITTTTEASLFQMLDLHALVKDVLASYREVDGGEDARIAMVLQQCKQRSSQTVSNIVIEKWHIKLAMDVDVLLLVMRALAKQEAAIEKYERSLALPGHLVLHDSVESTRHCYSELMRIMTEIYTLYKQELSAVLRKR